MDFIKVLLLMLIFHNFELPFSDYFFNKKTLSNLNFESSVTVTVLVKTSQKKACEVNLSLDHITMNQFKNFFSSSVFQCNFYNCKRKLSLKKVRNEIPLMVMDILRKSLNNEFL